MMDEDVKKIINRNKSGNSWIKMLIIVIVSSVFVIMLSYFMNGIYISGVPKSNEVTKIVIENHENSSYPKEFTDSESIQLACNLRNYLNYNMGEGDKTSNPKITINYETTDGNRVTIAANETTLWHEGKTHPLKKEGQFIKLANGVFDNK